MVRAGKKFKCSNSDCNETFSTPKSRNIHEQTCVIQEEDEEEEETMNNTKDTTMTPVEVGVKRNVSEDERDIDFSKKVRREGTTKIRLLMAGRYAGALIGKGGQHFKRLRDEFNIKITGLSTHAHNRVLCLDGERENCFSVIKEIIPSAPDAPYASQTQEKVAFELNLLVNTHQVGSIIGVGGSKIKEIGEKSGGKIKVYQDCLPNSNERVVSIGGVDVEQIIRTLEIVLDLLEILPSNPATKFYDPANVSTPLAARGILGQTGSPNDHAKVAAILMQNKDTSEFGRIPTVTTLVVPNVMCGAVIGKGGQNMRQVRVCSGAKIDITRTEIGSEEDRVITLTGTQSQIQIAQQLLGQFVSNSRNVMNTQQNS